MNLFYILSYWLVDRYPYHACVKNPLILSPHNFNHPSPPKKKETSINANQKQCYFFPLLPVFWSSLKLPLGICDSFEAIANAKICSPLQGLQCISHLEAIFENRSIAGLPARQPHHGQGRVETTCLSLRILSWDHMIHHDSGRGTGHTVQYGMAEYISAHV